MKQTSNLSDKVVLVTGASRGIGAAAARLFASEGAHVILCGRDMDALLEQEKQLNTLGHGTIMAIRADFKNETAIRRLFDVISERFSKLDVLINNAGILKTAPFEEQSTVEWDETYQVNIRALMLCSQSAFRLMKPQKKGTIINVSSLSGIKGIEKFPGMAAYIMSKHAVVGLTEALAVEGKPFGIRVNCIAPGAVNTAMLQDAFPNFHSETKPSDIAPTLLFLADEQHASKLTGAVIEIHCNP